MNHKDMDNAQIRAFTSVLFERKKNERTGEYEDVPLNESQKTTFFSGSIFYKFERTTLKFLVVDYRISSGIIVPKFPGGMCSFAKEETTEETCLRECFDETELTPDISKSEIVRFTMARQKDLAPKHYKAFYLHHEYEGELKKTSSDGGETSPPYWMAAEEVAEKIFNQHYQAAKRAFEILCSVYNKSLDHKTACGFAGLGFSRRDERLKEYFSRNI
ncbi:NUDIX domain-containing protein [Candidatus Nomurabacteria bacterium]|nr:NUDIX domain-containing protein [Candidatus Nomurabacteria bacterium]USN94812.1 MAG: NUDIX domain-containing protein [Candidatus Nomurabacteria bacterium]